MSYFLPAQLHARLKAAWWACRDRADGAPTLSALVERILLAHVAHLEQEHNEGQPFPAASRSAQGATRTASGGYRYVAYYLPADLHARLKAAWWALQDPSTSTLSAVVEELFVAEASRLEHAHNDGAEFFPAPAFARGVNSAAARRQGEWLRQEWESRRSTSDGERS